jgi:hypothetical protein
MTASNDGGDAMSDVMRRTRRWTVIAALAAAALAAGGCGGKSDAKTTAAAAAASPPPAASDAPAGGAGSSSGASAARTLKLESQLSAAPHAEGHAPGAKMVFTGMLFRPGGSSAIGRSQGSCTRTATGKGAVFQCLLSFVLHDGVIFAQSVSSMGGPANGAVTGGIGSYGGARGTFSYKANGTPRVDLTMRYAR